MRRYERSAEIFRRAQEVIPGGVNSPARAFRSVGGEPLVLARAGGAHVWDADGNRYIDYIGSWGPLILGHCHAAVSEAVRAALECGTSFGASTERELEMALLIREAFPSIEKVRLVNSGTEATMSAIRLARGFTGRDKIIKFEGCYHGHVDALLVKAGSGVATLGLPETAGVPAEVARQTIALPFNDMAALETAFREWGGEIACAIVEPVVGNMGCVPPAPGFLESLRKLTSEAGALLIFDEVMTGFRLSFGGFQQLSGIRPDLTTLGKIIGGGLPVGAYGGRTEVMSHIAPEGPVYQAGTLSGNPLAVAAGIATLRVLRDGRGVYEHVERMSALLCAGVAEAARSAGVPLTINRAGSMFTFFFTAAPVRDYTTAKASDTARFGKFFRAMLDAGVLLPPSQFEAAFMSAAHTGPDIDATIAAAASAIKNLE